MTGIVKPFRGVLRFLNRDGHGIAGNDIAEFYLISCKF
jgi:hypothetical protein